MTRKPELRNNDKGKENKETKEINEISIYESKPSYLKTVPRIKTEIENEKSAKISAYLKHTKIFEVNLQNEFANERLNLGGVISKLQKAASKENIKKCNCH